MTTHLLLQVLFFFLLITFTSYGGAQAENMKKVTNVGAIIDFNSRIGKEQRAAMEIAAQNFDRKSKNNKLQLHFQDSRRELLYAVSSAEKMIEEKNVQVLVGMETWQEATLVGKVANQTQVPVISLASPSITPPLMKLRWPFLITMSNNGFAEIKCIADLVFAYNWRKVIVIYEDEEHGGDSGTLSFLSEALQKIGSEIEYRLVLPPYSSLSDPKGVVLNELLKLLSVQSRVFIVLRCSLPMVSHLFTEAKKIGLLERDSAWIITESVTSLLDSMENSVISSMKGTLGIKTNYSKSSSSYKAFHTQFTQTFREENPLESNSNPGIHALRAYDSIQAIAQSIEKLASNTSATELLDNIVSQNFDGLSGKVSFNDGMDDPIFKIINVVGNVDKELARKKNIYKELGFWSRESGFVQSLDTRKCRRENRSDVVCKQSHGLAGSEVWPGNLKDRKPRGWAMPTSDKPLRIVVPVNTQFKKFVTVDESKSTSNDGYDGFSIQLFKMVVEYLKSKYDLPYKFEVSYVKERKELIQAVYNKTYDAIVGDVTILAERLNYVEFTQPYTESALSMVVPIKSEESVWMFMKPFTWDTWVATVAILVYTMFIVWFLEHPTNPEFSGSLKNQIGTSFSFTFSSLFFAHRERVHSNITRVVVTMWLLVVFILNASYTASLSSILTVKQLEPNVDIEGLKRTNQKVGCDSSFVCDYLQNLGFKEQNIIHEIFYDDDYLKRFRENHITAAFLEIPYEKVFLNRHCREYTTTTRTYRFGGLAFVFQKGSPIARDVSEAILKLSEQGKITKLEKEWLTPSNECSSTRNDTNETESLSLNSFWGIYLISGATSTLCFLLALFRLHSNYRRHQQTNGSNNIQTPDYKVLQLVRYFYNGTANHNPESASKTNSAISGPNVLQC